MYDFWKVKSRVGIIPLVVASTVACSSSSLSSHATISPTDHVIPTSVRGAVASTPRYKQQTGLEASAASVSRKHGFAGNSPESFVSSSVRETDPAGIVAAGNSKEKNVYCMTTHLRASVISGGFAGGSIHLVIRISNTGKNPCVVGGYPGVSMVAGNPGRQVGSAAQKSGPAEGDVNLEAGGSVNFKLDVGQGLPSGVKDPRNQSSCGKVIPTRGLRVYPSKNKAALFVPVHLLGCTKSAAQLMTVSSVGE